MAAAAAAIVSVAAVGGHDINGNEEVLFVAFKCPLRGRYTLAWWS